MSRLSDWSERLKAIFFRRRQERDLDEEVRFHVERETEELIRRGVDPAVARREALLAFGGVERIKEEVRDARGIRPLEDLAADVGYSLRGLRASPVFAVAAIAVLGLGLGAATAVFTIADRVLLAELPYPAADRLVRVYLASGSGNRYHLSTVDAMAIRDQQRSFDAFGIVSWTDAALSGVGAPEEITIGRVTADFFRALDVSAASGRLVQPGDQALGASAVAVVSDAVARERLGGASAAVGRSITIDGVSHVVVGVLPAGLDRLAGIRAAVWLPLQLETPPRRGPFWLRGFGRIRPGVTLDDATRDLAGISERIFPLWASGYRDQSARLTPVPLRESIVGQSRGQVRLFGGAVLLVLLVAIANVAMLLLVRASAREQELAIRAALGAGRSRLARLLVTDSIVLTVLAGAAGIGIAAIGLRLAGRLVPNLPRLDEVALNGRTLVFAAVVAAVSGVLVSAPSLLASLARGGGGGGGGGGSLRLDTRRVGTGRRSSATRSALVVAEFALALPLLVGAGLLLQSFVKLRRVDPGFDPRGAVAVGVALPAARYPDSAAIERFWNLLEQRVEAIPGVRAAGLTLNLPPDEPQDVNNFNLIDRPVPDGGSEPTAPWSAVSPGYFRALGIPLLAGRWLTAADSGTAPPVVLVSQSWARRYYPGKSPIGRQMISGGCYACPPTTVVGMVGDVKYLGLGAGADAVYSPLPQYPNTSLTLVVRSTAEPAAALRAVREVVAGLDPELPVTETTLERQLDRSLADPLRWTTMLGAFAATAVILAALGVFGLMSYAVRQRRREIGVRLALGAAPASVTGMVVRRGVGYALVGTAAGIALTLLEGRWLASFLFGIEASDPVTVAGVALLLLATAALACWLPGRQAARISPIEAISTE